MKINQIKLKNIGPYKGETTFSFRTNSEKNIILIGGQNGSGKTTLLNSIKFGLFGNYALGLKSESSSYIKTIKKMINYESNSQSAYIEIDFEIPIKNTYQNIVLNRSWNALNDSFSESVFIYQNNNLLDEFKTEEIIQQMKYSISPDLLKSFIYDGERISHDIDQGSISTYLNEMFESAFNFNVFSQLSKDLDTYLSKKSSESKSESEVYLFSISREINKTKDTIKLTKIELTSLYNKRDELFAKIKNLEKEIRLSGGLSKNEYESIIFSNESLIKNKDEKDRSMKSYVEYDLPLFMARELIEKSISQAKEEKTLQLMNFIENIGDQIVTDLSSLKVELENKNKDKKLIHDISEQQVDFVTKRIKIVEDKTNKIKKYLSIRDREIETINEAIIKLNKANSDHVKVLLSQKGIIENNIFNIESDILSKQKKVEDLELKLQSSISYYETETQKIMKSQMVNNSFLVGQRAYDLTQKIKKQLTIKKLFEVSTLTLEIFNKTMRKKNTISSMNIDDDFNIHLYDDKKQEFSISQFSAGEKQLLISSIIFSIFKLSNKSSLFIFDTPLARLDHENRVLFINSIIKKISDQVIILSTDSEFVGEYYNKISKNINSEYLLKYLEESKETKVLKDYFEVSK